MRWAILSTILAALLVGYGLCVPFSTMSFFIDRRTGIYHEDTTYFGIPIIRNRPVRTPKRGNPVGKAPLTASERSILVYQRIQRFPWSKAIIVHDEVGVWYAEAFHQMFHSVIFAPPQASIPDDEWDRIIKRRIPFWNSPELDRDPQAAAEAVWQENSDLFGVPAKRFFER